MSDPLIDIFESIAGGYEASQAKRRAADDDWAMWYADALLSTKGFMDLAGGTPDRTELIALLLKLDTEYLSDTGSRSKEEFFAARILELFL